MRGPRVIVAAALLGVAALSAACSSSSSSSTTTSGGGGATGSPIKIALIASVTGQAAAQFAESAQGFNAAIGAINAAGGANGHKLIGTVYDDQTNPSTISTQIQKAISDGNVGIVNDSPLFFLGAKYAAQANIPVTGGSFDGYEWGTPGFENMFASDNGSVDPTAPPSTGLGAFMKAHGGTTIGAWGYQISPSSLQAANNAVWSALAVGMKKGVLNTTVPFGSVDFTTAGLAAKQAGVDAVEGTMDVNSGVALTTALKQAGVNVKVNVFAAGYDPAIIGTPAWSDVQGAYFSTAFRPVSVPNAATAALTSALAKYANRPASKFPNFAIYQSYLGVELMAEGITRAAATPTSAGIIKALRSYTDWTGVGLIPYTVNFATDFGKAQNPQCAWYLQATKNGFTPVSSKPFCGAIIAGKSGKDTP